MAKNLITIGAFDGLHKGHKFLLDALCALAHKNNLRPLALVFVIPPRVVLSKIKQNTLLTLPREKFALFKQYPQIKVKKISFFDVCNRPCRDFFDSLIKDYNMGGFLAGRDFAFGKNRKGDFKFLTDACAKKGLVFCRANFLKSGKLKISSSLVRKHILEGDVKGAAKLLGRAYQISGRVIHGQRLGRKMGFPTANLEIEEHKILPRGVFAVEVFLGKERLRGICNIGVRPTVSLDGRPCVEVHILDFNRDIYGKKLTVNFISKIRNEKHFHTLGELIQQINKDSARAYKDVPL